ncbi:MAG: glycosyl hydrolase [Actinobacteria bacterium 13_2_20CM_2_72_6]|nr:MAG: glycosyl hydrolase [Actinobacteria bacterium 13_2_20CM_2_72_6]
MRFGANYTPSQHWWHVWLDFDTPGVVDGIRRDFDAIAGLGLDHVRVFASWPVFQPNRGVVRPRAVAQLVELTRLAGAAGLDVSVDALQGHLSSFDFYPSWTVTWHRRNLFTDPAVVEAQARLLRILAEALRGEPNYLGLNLGNEPNNLVAHNPVTAEEVDAWLDRLLAECAAADPAHPATHCAYDAVWYDEEHPFTPAASATKGAMTCVHPWVFSADCARRYGPLSVEVTHLAEYVVELSRAYATDPARMTWVQEFGAPAPHIPAADAPEFAERSLANVLTCAGLWGLTWWCSHDVDRRLVDFPELEYGLGLLRPDNTVKDLGATVAGTIAAARTAPPAVVARTTALVLPEPGRAVAAPGGAFFEAWMRRAAAGERPAVVLASRAADPAYLAARGATAVLDWV